MKRTPFALLVLALFPLTACGAGKPGSGGDGGAPGGGGASAVGGSSSSGGGSGGSGGSSSGGSGSGGSLPSDCPGGGYVSLTYDDSLSSQLQNAVPALDARGLRGTFFLTSTGSAWSALVASGHELASHTTVHPCPAASYANPGNTSEDFDLERMAAELDSNIAAIVALGQPEPLTFAYPCGIDWVGEARESYVPLLRERFAGARGTSGNVITAPGDAYAVPAYFSTGSSVALIDLAEQAAQRSGWVVFGFHGVGGDYLSVTAEAHEALLTHLVENEIPVLTFREGLACQAAL